MGEPEVVRRWEEFLDVLDRDAGEAAVAAAQSYIDEWERVFWEEGPGSPAFGPVPEELEFHNHLDPAGEQVYHGLEGMERFRADVGDVAPEVETKVEQVRRTGERVLLLGHGNTRGRLSGIPGRFPWGVVWTVRDRRIVRVDQFPDHVSARAHVGPEE